MITLYQPPPAWGQPSPSPFCVKLETYLHMSGIPFKVNHGANPMKAPTGKMPYIEENGQMMGDSGLIIDYLESKHSAPLDGWLTAEQRALSLAVRRMLEEHLYFGIVYSRWAIEANWLQVKDIYFGSLPPVVKQIVPKLARRQMLAALKGQGLGRHSQEKLYALCLEDINALAVLLGDKTYLHGEQVSSIDAAIYAFIAGLLWVEIPSPLREAAQRYPKLEAYCRRIQAQYFPN